jgi:phosphoserine phosphatase
MRRVPSRAAAVLALFLLACGSGRSDAGLGSTTVRLHEEGWLPENRARLERTIAELGRGGARFDPARPPVAVFDWDNTMMRGDIGDLVLAHAIENELLFAPEDWSRVAPLTEAALAVLARDCRAEPGAPLPTRSPECARAIAEIVWEGTASGAPAFPIPRARFYRGDYYLLSQLFAGHGEDELRAIARAAFDAAVRAPVGNVETIGGVEIDRFARLHAPMVELVRALESAGWQPWIVSASPQVVVEVVAAEAGIPRERVIGVRLPRGADGRLVNGVAECGEGELDTPVMPWFEGKRCWIQRAIFGVPESEQRVPQSDPRWRPALAAGDSDGDTPMLQSATALRVVLDRHERRLMCNALAHPESWLVQPLFVAPLPPRSEAYRCSEPDALGPIADGEGAAIPDRDP